MFLRKKTPAPVLDDDDDGFSSAKLKTKKTPADSRAELLSGGKARTAGLNDNSGFNRNDQSDPYDENPLRTAELQELREAAEIRSKEVTDSVRNAVKIAEETKNIASQTLVSLQDQGEQIRRTTDTTVKLEKELSKGEKLLNKLGPMFTPRWKTKKVDKIRGSSGDYDSRDSSRDETGRKELFLADGMKQKYKEEEDTDVPVWEREKKKQDEGLDTISNALEQLKNMGLEMGKEMDKQDKDLDILTTNVGELKSRLQQSNRRGKAIIKKG